MVAGAGRLSLPSIAHGPMAGPARRFSDREEDWREIEDMLAAPAPHRESARMRPRRYAAPIFASAVASSIVFAGFLTAALAGLPQWSCVRQLGACTTRQVAEAPVQVTNRAEVAKPVQEEKPLEAEPPARVADAGVPKPIAAPPIIQGRSVSEAAPEGSPETVIEPAPAAPEPRRHRHRHHRY